MFDLSALKRLVLTLGPTHDPGHPYPTLTNTHSYTTPGHYPLTMTTTYTGQYRTDTSDWIPIDGTAQAPAHPSRSPP